MSNLADYRERPHWSYSALNQFFNICSLQFAFQRILKLPAAFTPVALGFGSAYHRVMEHVALQRMEGGRPAPPTPRTSSSPRSSARSRTSPI